jgi:thiamine-monophosphate kinase
MGAVPAQAFLSLGLPAEAEVEEVDAFLDGFLEAAAAGGAVLAGGDTVASRSGWAVSVTVLGLVEEGRALRRDRARPGDGIFLSGPVGDSAAGLDFMLGRLDLPAALAAALVEAHNRPPFELALGRALVVAGGRCAIDVSDGLLADLGHILERSGVGARVETDRIPLSPALRKAAQAAGTDPLGWALAGGEDYRLLFTLEPGREKGLSPLHPIGEITEKSGLVLLRGGREIPAPKRGGYDHFPSA